MATYQEVKDIPNHPGKYLIDVRNVSELEETGILPSSLNIPVSELESAFSLSDDEFLVKYNRVKPSMDSEIIFSCKLGGRAQKAADQAASRGFTNAKAYKGSWTEYAQKEGLKY
ncbi:TSTD3.2 family protein [Megaselia abdita]